MSYVPRMEACLVPLKPLFSFPYCLMSSHCVLARMGQRGGNESFSVWFMHVEAF